MPRARPRPRAAPTAAPPPPSRTTRAQGRPRPRRDLTAGSPTLPGNRPVNWVDREHGCEHASSLGPAADAAPSARLRRVAVNPRHGGLAARSGRRRAPGDADPGLHGRGRKPHPDGGVAAHGRLRARAQRDPLERGLHGADRRGGGAPARARGQADGQARADRRPEPRRLHRPRAWRRCAPISSRRS